MSAQGSFPELTEAGTLGASPGVVTRPDGAKVAPGGDMSLEKTANNLAEVNDKDKDGKASLSTRDTGSSRGDKPVDTSRQTGDVQTYLFYIQSVGWWATIIFFLAILGFVFSVSFPSESERMPASPWRHAGVRNADRLGSARRSCLGSVVGRRQRNGAQRQTGILAWRLWRPGLYRDPVSVCRKLVSQR